MKGNAKYLISMLCLLVSANIKGQNPDYVIETLFENQDYDSEFSVTQIEYLTELYQHKTDINAASASKLADFPFLTLSDITKIRDYIVRHGKMLTLSELQLTGIDNKTVRLLKEFVYVGDGGSYVSEFEKETVRNKGEMSFKMDIPFYKRKGFEEKYAGSVLSHGVRLKYSIDNGKYEFGLATDKDAGERFLDMSAPGYDFVSGYVSASGLLGFKKIVLGNMRLSYGMGLVFGSGFSMGKTVSSTSVNRPMQGLKGYASASESGFINGVGLSRGKGPWTITASLSMTPMDATMKNDTISSFKTDGYHRTELEISKKENVNELLGAIHMDYRSDGIILGTTVAASIFDHYKSKGTKEYMKYRASGTKFFNASVDASVYNQSFSLASELAVCESGGMAGICSYSRNIARYCNIKAIARVYSPRYHSFHGSGFSESGLENEQGIYLGILKDWKNVNVEAYADLFRFPFMKYGVSVPSVGSDWCIITEWQASESDFLTLQNRLKLKQEDCQETGYLEFRTSDRIKLKWKHSFTESLSLLSQLNGVSIHFPVEPADRGFSILEQLSYTPKAGKLSASISLCGFLTDSYKSSVSVFEKGLLYSFNCISLYGKGIRASVLAKMSVGYRLKCYLKLGSTVYFDREQIGSSLQLIDSNHKEDLSIQLIYRL